MEYQIVSDGSCDLPSEVVEANHLKVVPFYNSFDGVNYEREDSDAVVASFYRRMVETPGVYPKTSVGSIQDYLDAFAPAVEAGKGVICLCIAATFSGSYNAAHTAKVMLEEEHDNARIAVIETGLITLLQGLLVMEGAYMQQAGYDFDQTVQQLEELKDSGRIFFTINNLDYLHHGGRIGKLTALVAGGLKMKPIIYMQRGEITPIGVTISRGKAKQKVLEQLKEYFVKDRKNPDDYRFIVGYGYDRDEGLAFRDAALRSIASYTSLDQLGAFQIGSTIGIHTGPHPLGVGILKRYDRV